MTTCFIKWDNSYSYKLANPDNNFSIIDVQGSAFKIIWDGGGTGKEHTIRNPTNYSYSVIPSDGQKVWIYYQTLSGKFRVLDYSDPVANFNLYNSLPTSDPNNRRFTILDGLPQRNGSYPNFLATNSTRLTLNNLGIKFDSAGYTVMSNSYPDGNLYVFEPGDIYFQIFPTHISPVSLKLSGVINYSLKIIDNNVTYIYLITNTNSVQTIYSQGGKKIQIEGNQYDIIDANSAYKDCDKHCLNGLIECQCGNQLCCYKKTNSGYELVSTIKL